MFGVTLKSASFFLKGDRNKQKVFLSFINKKTYKEKREKCEKKGYHA